MKVVPFCPFNDGAPEDNVTAFVAYARDRSARFGRTLDFDAPTWDVTGLEGGRSGVPTSIEADAAPSFPNVCGRHPNG